MDGDPINLQNAIPVVTGKERPQLTATGTGRRGGGSEKRGYVEETVKVLQINLHRSGAAAANLAAMIAEESAIVVLVQEPPTIANRVYGRPPHSEIHVEPAGKTRPRACIFTRGVEAWPMTGFIDCDLSVVKVRAHGQDLIIASSYMAAEHPAPPAGVKKLVDYCENRQWPLIIGTDSNSHNTAWGSTDVNHRGEQLMDYLLESSLMWANHGTKPTFVTRTRAEVLDITVYNNKAAGRIKDWKVEDSPTLSDHRAISFSLPQAEVIRRRYRPVKRTDWVKYQEILDRNQQKAGPPVPLLTEQALEQEACKLEDEIIEAYHEACPEREVKAKADVPWWTNRLEELRTKVRTQFHRATRNSNERSWEIYGDARREFKRELRKAKRNSWRRLTEEIEGAHPLARTVKILARDATTKLSMVQKDGKLTESHEETLATMLSHHVPASSPGLESRMVVRARISAPRADSMVTESLAGKALKVFSPYKSPGPDGIYPILLQKAWETGMRYRYLEVLKASLRLAYIPERWRKGKGIFLPKPGKASYLEVKAFRMITLTSFQLKWLERLVLWDIVIDKRVKARLNQKQYGFKEGMSTDTALHELTYKIERSLINGEFALGIFLDIENAFPTVETCAIQKAMDRIGVNKGTQAWLASLLSGRTVESSLGQTTTSREVTRGCPQGGILSPFMWNAVIDELLHTLEREGLHAQAYADDIAGLFTGIDPATLVTRANRFMAVAANWGKATGLTFSKAKTEAVVFTRKVWQTRATLRLEGVQVNIAKEAKYLGVILDKQLTFNSHIKERTTKAKRAWGQINRLIGKTWGLKPAMARWAYVTMIRPIITYGAVAWVTALKTEENKSRLQKVQSAACRAALAAYPYTPTAALEMLLDLKPLPLQVEEIAVMTSVRLKSTGHWPRQGPLNDVKKKSHVSICNSLVKGLTELHLPWDQGKIVHLPKMNFRTLIEDRVSAADLAAVTKDGKIRCFTDGSKTQDGETGAGAIIVDGDDRAQERIPLGKWSTVFQAEVAAIEMTVQSLRISGKQNREIIFLVDNQAAIMALGSNKTCSRLVASCRWALTHLAEHNKVSIAWVPGHSDIEGNEAADAMAKEGTKVALEYARPLLPLPMATVKAAVRRNFDRKHEKAWWAEDRFRETKEAIGWAPAWLKQRLLKLNRKGARWITQMITGHCSLAVHRHRAAKVADDTCPKCLMEAETPDHHVGKCIYFEKERRETLGVPSTSLRAVLEARNIGSLMDFLEKTKRLEEL
jgi:ribonuclease HI